MSMHGIIYFPPLCLQSLEKMSKMFKADIEREKRGKQGVENLAKALLETPKFGSEDSQQDVNDKLQHVSKNNY